MASSRTARPIAGVLFGVQLAVMVVVVAIIAGVGVARAVGEAEAVVEQRIQEVADTIRHLPTVVTALRSDDPTAEIQPIVDAAISASGFQYITVADLDGIRVAHVDPDQIGRPVSSDHAPIRAGGEFRGIESGPQGVTYRVKLPIIDGDDVVGTISVGELVSDIRQEAFDQSLPIAATSLLAIALGALLAWLVSRWLRRRLYGVEPSQVVGLLHAHQAVMDSGQEGIVTLDPKGRIQLINAEAARLLGLAADAVPPLIGAGADALPEEVRDLLDEDADRGRVHLRHFGDFSVYVQAGDVRHGNRIVGRMVSLRDRTELDRAMARLQAEQAEAELLRIEAHEFENRMHLVSGLIELEEYDEARSYLEGVPGARPVASVEAPMLAALVSAHIGVAAREHVTLGVAPESSIPAAWPVDDDTLLVLANLLNNAVEATGFGGVVQLLLSAEPEAGILRICVDDDGPGFEGDPGRLLRRGETSKEDAANHGIGLASVLRVVEGRGGRLVLGESPLGGARVEVLLPATTTGAPPPTRSEEQAREA
ncbi:ATP-binding protein [Microbacterium sp. 179-B 1A2 NHS]|uniref:sensor histidine kinase n=1 Tax=Microbacterium sp. 179-B 1A2 NHS TaxID=3142383 RepID=UPI0039A281B9